MRIAFVILVSLPLTTSQTSAGGQRQLNRPSPAHYIDALVAYQKFGRIYVEDGAADGSVTLSPSQPVKNILDLGPAAIPLLIAHLDDTRLTSASFVGGFTRGTSIRVPVGHLCLDILMKIVGENRNIFVKDCADDGLGACVKEGYYFRPDDYYPINPNEYRDRLSVRVVKSNWRRAYRRGWLMFRRPS